MKKVDFTIFWGVVLVAAGVLFLVQSLVTNGDTDAWAGVWAAIFGAAGLAFAWWFFSDLKGAWWAAIPAAALISLGVITGLAALGFTERPEGDGSWLGAIFLAGISLGFWAVYAVRREHWWALIPGGVLLTLGVVALSADFFKDETPGAIFFFGLALTFALVGILPTPQHGHMTWAFIPAVVLAVLGAVVLFTLDATVVNYVVAAVLILAGAYLLYRQRGGGAMLPRG